MNLFGSMLRVGGLDVFVLFSLLIIFSDILKNGMFHSFNTGDKLILSYKGEFFVRTCVGSYRKRYTSQRYRLQELQLTTNDNQQLETSSNIWQSRRKISRIFLQSRKKWKDFRYRYFKPSDDRSSTNKTNEFDSLTWISVLGLFLVPLLLRVGSRVTIAELVGSNLLDESLTSQLTSFISYLQSLGQEKYILLFLAWFLAKAICLDYLSLTLAIGSGIIFDNVWIATGFSILASSISSLLIFLLTRSLTGEGIQENIAKRPLLRAINRSCQENGFKTVFSLRLSPVLPIPIAAYNYLYAMSSVSVLDFFFGITLGSIKPYLLDSYLGVFLSQSLFPSSVSAHNSGSPFGGTINEGITLGIIATILLV